MAALTLYGMAGSRAIRSIWAMEEVGVPYTHVPTHFIEESKAADYVAINPNGRIPCLVDGDLVLFESMAINLYMAETYKPELLPAGAGDRAKAVQWSVWAISEIEPLQMQLVMQQVFTPKEQRSDTVIAEVTTKLDRPLSVLNSHLADRSYLVSDAFTIADLNLAGVMDVLEMIRFDLAGYPHVRAWLDRCYARPSYASAKTKDDRELIPSS